MQIRFAENANNLFGVSMIDWISVPCLYVRLSNTSFRCQFAALLTLVVIIAINLAVGILPHVDNFAHIGGFLTGFFLGFVILIRPQFGYISQKNAPLGYHSGSIKRKHKTYQYVLWIIASIALIVG